MSNDRITDRDAERIANAVGRKLLRYALVAILFGLALPIVCTYAFRASGG